MLMKQCFDEMVGKASSVKKKVAMAVVAVLAVLLLAVFCAAWYMLDYALAPAADARDMAGRYERMYSEYPYMRHWVDSMRSAKALRDTFIVMPDGLRHHAVYARAGRATARTAVLVHGYKDSHAGMLPLAKMYAGMGYNILLPDLHAHGLSEGSGPGGCHKVDKRGRQPLCRFYGTCADGSPRRFHGRGHYYERCGREPSAQCEMLC